MKVPHGIWEPSRKLSSPPVSHLSRVSALPAAHHVFRVNERIIHRHHLHILLHAGAEHQATDASESVQGQGWWGCAQNPTHQQAEEGMGEKGMIEEVRSRGLGGTPQSGERRQSVGTVLSCPDVLSRLLTAFPASSSHPSLPRIPDLVAGWSL